MRLSSDQLRKHLWLLPALAALLLSLRWVAGFGRPVHVADLPAPPAAIRDGKLVTIVNNRGRGASLVVQTARGGRARSIALPAGQSVSGVQLTDTHVVYLANSLFREVRGRPSEYAGRFAYELHRVPLRGSEPEVVRFQGEFGAILTRKGCFWWGSRDGDDRSLCFLPLEGGDVQTIGRGYQAALAPGPRGGAVLFMPPAAGGRARQSVRTEGDGRLLIEQVAGTGLRRMEVPLGDRLYWVERDIQPPEGAEPRPDRIMSVRSDGLDRQTLLEANHRAVQFGQLEAHGEALYWTLIERRPSRAGTETPTYATTLCRARPGEAAEPQRVCVLPGNGGICYFDGDDVYCAVQEERENWWDWSPQGLQTRRVTAWYHFRLPD